MSNRAGNQAGEFNPTSREFGLPLPEQIAEVLATEIIKRELTPGSRLPEPALAERFGTSRAPIREALYLLDQAGLVERAPRRGTVVKAYTRREIEEIYQVRITLERRVTPYVGYVVGWQGRDFCEEACSESHRRIGRGHFLRGRIV